jgi:hypothetical protein
MNTISDRIDALKTSKKSKKDALIEGMLFIGETADTQPIMIVTMTEADTMEIEDIETMLINSVYRKIINRQTKMNNLSKTVKMIKMISKQCKLSNLNS